MKKPTVQFFLIVRAPEEPELNEDILKQIISIHKPKSEWIVNELEYFPDWALSRINFCNKNLTTAQS